VYDKAEEMAAKYREKMLQQAQGDAGLVEEEIEVPDATADLDDELVSAEE
jgi:hypothetical protein